MEPIGGLQVIEKGDALEHHVQHGGGLVGGVVGALAGKQGLRGGHEVGHWSGAEVLFVEPLGLVRVEPGPAFDDAVQVEHLGRFVQGEQLLLGAGVPPEEEEHVHEGLGQVAGLAVAIAFSAGRGVGPAEWEDGEATLVAVSLGQLSVAGGLEDEGQVAEPWRRPTKGAIHKDVLGRGDLPFNAAQYITTKRYKLMIIGIWPDNTQQTWNIFALLFCIRNLKQHFLFTKLWIFK